MTRVTQKAPVQAAARIVRSLALGLAICAVAPAFGAPESGAAKREYAQAIRSYKEGRLAEAFARFVVLANHGDPDAARIALFMHRYGPTLFGRYWDLAPHEVEGWENITAGRIEAPARSILLPQPTSTRAAPKSAKPQALTPVALPVGVARN